MRNRLRTLAVVGWCGIAAGAGLQVPDAPPPTFQSGARLVEVDVVVRSKGAPVKGLTKDDFTILDQGKPQHIDEFRAGSASTLATPVPLPAGVVSNRVNRQGEPRASATVILFDQLNTRFDLKAYQRQAVTKLIRSLGPSDRVGIYALGKDLHVLQEFTDDPQKLLAALAKLDAGRDLNPDNLEDALFDYPVDMEGNITPLNSGDPLTDGMYKDAILRTATTNVQVNAAINGGITSEALGRIVEHLSGMPGRRNLIWVKEQPSVPPAVLGMLTRANIALYPVLIRTVTTKGDIFGVQLAGRNLAQATGGVSFDDAGDLRTAMDTAEEDSRTAYTLGYYPAEDKLDGKYHQLRVALAANVAGLKASDVEIRYRPGYVASKQSASVKAPSVAAALTDFLANPLDSTGVGLTGQLLADSEQGKHQVRLVVDLHDVHLERKGERSVGAVQLAYLLGASLHTTTVQLEFTEAQLERGLASGYSINLTGVGTTGDSIRVLVRDPATGAAGSLKIPVR